MLRSLIGSIFASGLILSTTLLATAQTPQQATATLQDRQGNVIGNAVLEQTAEGVQIQVQLENFDAAVNNGGRGEHGFHIHQVGECVAPDFTSAGAHFNPTDARHGLLAPDGAHGGDLVNLWIESDGSADYSVVTNLITLGSGDRNILDEDGSALVIHADADDYHTDSSGNSGDRIACGVITPAS